MYDKIAKKEIKAYFMFLKSNNINRKCSIEVLNEHIRLKDKLMKLFKSDEKIRKLWNEVKKEF